MRPVIIYVKPGSPFSLVSPLHAKLRDATTKAFSLLFLKNSTIRICKRDGKVVSVEREREREGIAGKGAVDSDKTIKRMGRPWFSFLYSLAAFFSLSQTQWFMYSTNNTTHTYTYVYTENCGPHTRLPYLASRTTITSIHPPPPTTTIQPFFTFPCRFDSSHIYKR